MKKSELRQIIKEEILTVLIKIKKERVDNFIHLIKENQVKETDKEYQLATQDYMKSLRIAGQDMIKKIKAVNKKK